MSASYRVPMLAVGLLVAGCTALGSRSEDFRFERMELVSPVRIAAGDTRVRFQQGAPRPMRHILVWEPSCALVFVPAADSPREIEPAAWRVIGIRRTFDAGSWQRGVNVYGIEVRLAGDEGKEAPERFLCEVWRTPEQLQKPLSRGEILQAVGRWIRFQ